MDNSILGWIWALFYRVFSLIYCCEVVYKDGPRPRLIRRTPSSRCCMAKVVDLWGPKIATVPTHSLKIHAGSAPGPTRISRMGRAYFTLMKNQWIWACCWSIAAQWEQTRGHLDPTGIQDAFTVAKATLPRVALIEIRHAIWIVSWTAIWGWQDPTGAMLQESQLKPPPGPFWLG